MGRGFLAAVLSSCMPALAAYSSSAPFLPSSQVRVSTYGSGQARPGVALEVQSCQPGFETQTWSFPVDGSIRSVASGLCITAPMGLSGPGALTTDLCQDPLNPGQVFDIDATAGVIALRGSSPSLVLNASFGSYNYGWVRPYAPLGVAFAAGSSPSNSTGYAPFQLFLANTPANGSIVANASTLSAPVCVDAGYRAPLTLVASVFGSHMVLQRNSNATALYGWAPSSAASVTVTMERGNAFVVNISATPDAAAAGAWRAPLPVTDADSVPWRLTVQTSDTSVPPIVLEDVLWGDVYFATGQSNMQFSVQNGVNVSAELDAANAYPNIRLFTVGLGTFSVVPLPQLQTVYQQWVPASNTSVGDGAWGAFSAVGWYFGRDLYNLLNGTVPIGLVGNNWGGTPIEVWSDAETLARCPANGPVDPTTASTMYNAMMVPYIAYPGPMAVQGWVWYQGEANAGDPNYACRLPALIDSWRSQFGAGAGPAAGWFGVVQLAAWDCCPGDVVAVTRDIQLNTSLLHPNTGFGTAADLGDINSTDSSIHPRFKQPLGARLAASALAMSGGASGAQTIANPIVASVTAAKAAVGSIAVSVTFDDISLGPGPLFINASIGCPWGVPSYDCANSGWMLQTADGQWHNATAALSGDSRGVVLTAAAATDAGPPIAASLGWGSWPILPLARVDTGAVALPFLRSVVG